MAAPLALALAPALIDMGKDFIKRMFPDPADQAKAEMEWASHVMSHDLMEDKNFRDFVIQYEGLGDKVHPFIQILRGSVRPVLTYSLAGFFLWGFVNPGAYEEQTMTMLWQLNLISLGFWYGERALKNLGVDLGKK
jgi:hypothetical protein